MPSRFETGWLRYTSASFLTRFPQPMGLLVLQLVGVRLTGRLADGAVLVGVTSLCGVAGPWMGRWYDRGAASRRLQGTGIVLAASLAGIALCVQLRSPYWLVVFLTVIQGSCLAGTWTGFRSMMSAVVPGERREQAHYIESLMVEVGYALGPLVASLVLWTCGVAAAVWAMAGAELAGVALLARLRLSIPASRPPRPRDDVALGGGRRVRAVPALRWLPGRVRVARMLAVPIVVAGVSSFGFSMIESNIPARMPGLGLPESSAGMFMALLAGGSCVGGLVVSLVPYLRRKALSRPDFLFAGFTVCNLPAAMATHAWLYAVALPVNALPLVSLSGLSAADVERRVGIEARAEGFGLVNASTRLVGGIGTITGGLLLEVLAPDRIPFVASGAFLLTAVGLRAARRPARVDLAAAAAEPIDV